MGKKILLVDDEPELVAMVKTRLEANHYEVITAADGQEGLDRSVKTYDSFAENIFGLEGEAMPSRSMVITGSP